MYKFLRVLGPNDLFLLGFGPPNFPGAKSGWFGAFLGKRSILTIFPLDREISAHQCWPSKGVMYKSWSVKGQNGPFPMVFGLPNFPGAKSGWFGAFLRKWSIFAFFANFTLRVPLEYPILTRGALSRTS